MTDRAPKSVGASIRIFLVDGEADGLWVVEKSNWTGKAIMAPRTRYRDFRRREDLDGPGVYVLAGPSEDELHSTRIYIGETDDLPSRLDSHQREKDFWNRAIVFTSKDDNLNKAHIRYLESRLIGLATTAKRSVLENGNNGSTPRLSEAETAEAESFLAEMLLIYPVLGLQAFQHTGEASDSSNRLVLDSKDTRAEGSETSDGFVVFAGSTARAEATRSLDGLGLRLRNRLIDAGGLVAEGTRLRLVEDHLFPSPSAAASAMAGRSANGRVEWKSLDGRTLKDLQSVASEDLGPD